MSYGWPSQETRTYIIEVGRDAARRTQTMPRDLRWFRGLWR